MFDLNEVMRDIDAIKEDAISERDMFRIEFFAMDSEDPVLLRKISRLSKHLKIRYALALNKHTPGDVLNKYVTDKEKSVRVAVVNNPNLEITNLIQLTFDADETVKSTARDRVSKIAEAQGGQDDQGTKS